MPAAEDAWPRPVREVREHACALARDAWNRNRLVDPDALERLAQELDFAVEVSRIYGGDPAVTERFAQRLRDTAELARMMRANSTRSGAVAVLA